MDGIQETQSGSLLAQNDFHNIRIPINLIVNGGDELAGWAIALIVIGSIAAAGIIGYLIYIKLLKQKPAHR